MFHESTNSKRIATKILECEKNRLVRQGTVIT